MPSHILEHIGSKSFAQLSSAEQQEVLQYLTREEYDAFHEAASLAHDWEREAPQPDPAIGQHLQQQFEKRYNKERPSVMLYPVQLWKVAAVFLLMAGAGTWLLLQAKGKQEVTYITLKDTVYVPSFASGDQALKIYDTVYIKEQDRTVKKEVRHRAGIVTAPESHEETTAYVPAAIPGLHMLTIREKDALSNRPKGNSIKDDSLLQHYRFVRL